ncbi:asparaginase domain-containing protein [Synoicihabitans lomoniglobus]|uniref:Asparaginase domain-containing protein n=1 Tax=Synoicihabitans lomoniglobus TaxID=2909285 RepID=A0AAF0CIC6_9BACT|nr:asparaginase domain-containing protein [Opitutaceae bacterium LMO-M01]WED65237.1 asparaginase domain-containing protein [Opitutaceae bacterium LMO-M01]
MSALEPPRIRVIATGGTIDKVYFDAKSDYEIGEPQAGAILHEAGVTFDFTVESVLRKDSLQLTDADRALVRERVIAATERHILITHGTDTMTDTAAVLADIPDKVIVFTGSMLPARFRQNDAVFNVGCAIGGLLVQRPGVYIAMNGQLFPADRVRKNREKLRFEER